ncbi:DMT family transporter [Gordonia sp. ABSL11-1]|uniref:DMT family transporter n=1 Tax=Gordonia sp. ABSL11-1 TaxID=3053924 RepID=UPI002573EB73|nr:DMT family transporter [Gordonia sp. ABSL11-1]MDL9948014.1 DMT family transporter [Gordonia sp. ABSL11-1]
MSHHSSAIAHDSRVLSPRSHLGSPSAGLAWGLVGVVAFSFTVPFTRIAVAGLDPLFIGCARAVVAACLAAVALVVGGASRPTTRQWLRLAPVSAGVVAGFPILTSLALRDTAAGHSAVVIGLLPAATAVVAVSRTHERPGRRFWVGAALGVIATIAFTVAGHGVPTTPGIADLYLLAAVVLAAVGYAQGGVMARELGSWQTICWALILASPAMLVTTLVVTDGHLPHATAGQWAAFGYLAAISMFLGFFAWYRGLAIGPMTTVSQVQLIQPVLTVVWAILLLGERPTPELVVGGAAVIGCAAFTVRSRVATGPGGAPVSGARTGPVSQVS